MFEKFGFGGEQQGERELSAIELEMRFNMEREMMRRYLVENHLSPDNDEQAAQLLHNWETHYLDTFKEIVEDMRREDPDFVIEWQEHPEAVSDRVEARLKAAVPVTTVDHPEEFRKAA